MILPKQLRFQPLTDLFALGLLQSRSLTLFATVSNLLSDEASRHHPLMFAIDRKTLINECQPRPSSAFLLELAAGLRCGQRRRAQPTNCVKLEHLP